MLGVTRGEGIGEARQLYKSVNRTTTNDGGEGKGEGG